MYIRLNMGNKVAFTKELKQYFISVISDELENFDEMITRIEVHLSDEDGNKKSRNDKRCLIEARLKGLQPIVVSDHADTHEYSVLGAVDKMKSSLTTILDKNKTY